MPMNPQITASIQESPNEAYAQEYIRINGLINDLSAGSGKLIQQQRIATADTIIVLLRASRLVARCPQSMTDAHPCALV